MLQVEAFRPFFVSLTLPYSVVRGEQLVLQANVFNYMQDDMNVRIKSIIARTFVANERFKSFQISLDLEIHEHSVNNTYQCFREQI